MVFDLVITRHKALVEYLKEKGMIDNSVTVIEHASPDDVLGKNVIGVMPLSLAVHAASVTEIPLTLTPDMRGKELGLEEVRQVAGPPTTYVVRHV